MSINDNIASQLDGQFENSGKLPQKLDILDLDKGLSDYLKSINLSVLDGNDRLKTVPVIWVSQEIWAERKNHWNSMTNEEGEEISRPFIALTRKSVKQGTAPLKRTIPVKKKFTYRKIAKFNGTVKGYELYRIPQPSYVDVDYEARFVTSYTEDANLFYEKVIRDCFSDRQAYMNINGYQIRATMGDPSEDNKVDIMDERTFQVAVPITVFGKLLDPSQFERVNTVTRIAVKITEQRS